MKQEQQAVTAIGRAHFALLTCHAAAQLTECIKCTAPVNCVTN